MELKREEDARLLFNLERAYVAPALCSANSPLDYCKSFKTNSLPHNGRCPFGRELHRIQSESRAAVVVAVVSAS